MKKLTLIRHAKSSHGDGLLRDFDRPLSARGLRDAPLIGRHLREVHSLTPDAVITSPALRALTTASIVVRELGLTDSDLRHEPRIYEAPVRSLASVVQGIPDNISHAILFGHNPGLEDLSNWLCGRRAVQGLRTGGVVMLELKLDSWQDADLGSAGLLTYFYPALIGGGKDAHGD